MITGERFRMAGFWCQLVLLGLIDAATLVGFSRGGVPIYHYVGFIILNAVLLVLTAIVWRSLRQMRRQTCAETTAGREGDRVAVPGDAP